MKKIQFFTLLCSFVFLLSACQKDGDTTTTPTDPRNAFVGTYYITADEFCSACDGTILTNTYSNTIVVSKGANANDILFTDNYQTGHRVTLTGSNFKIEPFQISSGGTGSGSGSFGSNSISYNLTKLFGSNCARCDETGSGTK